MYRIIQELNEAGTTVIMISHDLTAAETYAKHTLRMGKEVCYA